MKKRAYQVVSVGSVIYCSSSFDHFTDVLLLHNGKREVRDYWIDGGVVDRRDGCGELILPAYVHRDIDRLLLEILKSGNAQYHEYDRDGNKRWEDFRYHDEGWQARRIAYLEQK